MKIKEITKEEIVFDNGSRIWFDQEYDDCAYNYADFYQIDDIVREWEFDENLKFELCSGSGFRFGNEGRMIFVPCYSYQNGYYSTEINIYYGYRHGEALIDGGKVLGFSTKMDKYPVV